MKLPEYYTNPERYRWFILETNRGPKRTFAKTKAEAIAKAEKKGLTVFKTIKGSLERLTTNKRR